MFMYTWFIFVVVVVGRRYYGRASSVFCVLCSVVYLLFCVFSPAVYVTSGSRGVSCIGHLLHIVLGGVIRAVYGLKVC